MIAPCAYSPVETSVTATPTLQGGPFGPPVLRVGMGNDMRTSRMSTTHMCISPASPSMITSYPAA